MVKLYLFLVLTLASGCASQINDVQYDSESIESTEEAVQIVERTLQDQIDKYLPVRQVVNSNEFIVYIPNGRESKVEYIDVSKQELFVKRNVFVAIVYINSDGGDKRVYYYRSSSRESAVDFMNAIHMLSEYNKTADPQELINEPKIQRDPAWPGVREIIGEVDHAHCEYLAQMDCGTGFGASGRCKEWHFEQAKKLGANGVKLGKGRGRLRLFTVTGWAYSLTADYWLCTKDPVAPIAGDAPVKIEDDSIIGEWRDPSSGKITILKNSSGEIFLLTELSDGGKSITPLEEGKYRTGRKFSSDSTDGIFYIIKPAGTLELYDNMGLVREIK